MGDDDSVLSRPAPEPDVVVSYGPGALDVADVQLGGDDEPLLIVVHGGFWRPAYDRLHLRTMLHALAAEGFTAAAPEYRRIPGDPNAALEDVRVALRILPVELRGRHDGRVVVLGHSAGGHLALWAASVAPAAGLVATVALAPVADLAGADRERLGDGAVEAFLGGPASSRPELDPTRMVSSAHPVTLVHGADDAVVPLHQSETYAAAHRGTVLDAVPGAGHFDLIDPTSPAWPEVLAAIHAVANR
ncbi:MAG TPA: alpha/beta hydrolase [Candidatus Nanopelagicales bacterium]